MILATADALEGILRGYEDEARNIRRYAPSHADLLERVAGEIRGALAANAPEWVPLAAVAQWTGWSKATLRKRCRDEMEPRGLARKIGAGEWEVAMDTAVQWPRARRREHMPDIADPVLLGRMLGREG